MEKGNTIWKVIAVILGVLIVLGAAGSVLLLVLPSGTVRAGSEKTEQTEIQASQPTEEETQMAEEITVTSSGTESTKADTAGNAEKGEDHRYEIINERMTWAEAEAYCEAEGGHLATVGSEEEYAKILEAAGTTSRQVLWLGASRQSDGTFRWVDGEELSYTDWMTGEPNNETGDEDYLVMFIVNGEWVWSDVPNDVSTYYGENTVGFVCEWDE